MGGYRKSETHLSVYQAYVCLNPQPISGSVSSKLLYSAPLAGLTTPPMLASQAPQLTSQWNANSPHWLVAFCILHGLAEPQ